MQLLFEDYPAVQYDGLEYTTQYTLLILTTKMKTIEKLLQEIGVAILLFITLLTLSYFLFADRRTEDQRQLDEMVDYQRSQGRNDVIEDGYIIIR